MLNGVKLTYLFVMANTVLVQLAIFAVAKIDGTGKVAAELAFFLMLSAFSTSVLTLGGVNVTVDMSRRSKLKDELPFYFYVVIGGALFFSALIFFSDLIGLDSRSYSVIDRAFVALYVLAVVVAAFSGSVSAVFGRPSDSSTSERLYVVGVAIFLIGALFVFESKVAAYGGTIAICAIFSRRLFSEKIRKLLTVRPKLPSGQGVTVLAWNFSNSFLAYGFQYLDTFLVGVCLNQKELGVYFFLVQLSFVPKYLSVQLGRVILPYLNKIEEAGHSELRRLQKRLLFFIAAVTLISVVVLVGMRNGGLNYFGALYESRSLALSILIAGSILSLPGPVLYSILISSGYTKEFARVNIIGGGVLLTLQALIFLIAEHVDLFSLFAAARFFSTAFCQVLLILLVRKRLPTVWALTRNGVLFAVTFSLVISVELMWESLKV